MNALLALLLLLLTQVSESPERVEVRAALTPDSAYIGQRFTLSVWVSGVPEGAEVRFPALPDSGLVTALAAPLVAAPLTGQRSARYSLAAWDVGVLALPALAVTVVRDGAELRLPLPLLTVRVVSVLPSGADPAALAWRPPADVLGGNWSSLDKALAAAALALALAAMLFHLRRRDRARPFPAAASMPPRERALEAFDRLARSGLLEAGELKGFYSALSLTLRQFLAEEEEDWGPHLTTGEIKALVGGDGVAETTAAALSELLEEADMVKFARRRPSRVRAARALEAARNCVSGFARLVPEPAPPPPEPVAVPAVAAAAAESEGDVLAEIERLFSESEPAVEPRPAEAADTQQAERP
jgi:hypothetical protein